MSFWRSDDEKEKTKKVSIVLIILLAVCGGIFLFYKYYVIQNAFDQMYYSRVRHHYDWFGGNRSTLFSNMKQLEGITKDGEMMATQDGMYTDVYSSEYIPENAWLHICTARNKKYISFSYKITFEETQEIPYEEYIWLSFTYYLNTKELKKEAVLLESDRYSTSDEKWYLDDKEQISEFLKSRDMTWEEIAEIYDWYFYDVFLTDWFEANARHTRFSLDNLGKYTMVYENDET